MRRDKYINSLRNFSILTMLAVKSFTVIVFVFLVLVAGLKNSHLIAAYNSENPPQATTPFFSSIPVPDVALGLSEMPIPTEPPATATLTFTPTLLATNTNVPTSLPSSTMTATETSTSTPTLEPSYTPTNTEVFTQTLPAASETSVVATPTLPPTVSLPTYPTLTPTVPGTTAFANGQKLVLTNSPLQGIDAVELQDIITQPFIMPPPGEDSGHHGTDFAFWRKHGIPDIQGLPILSVFSGKVVSAYDKLLNPYGYMVIVETPLSALPKEVLDAINSTPLQPISTPGTRLTCPTGFVDWWNTSSQSLYVLYGHMENAPAVKLGQSVNVGDILGAAGNTGQSSMPHLHLEMRIGPSDAIFYSMGHYDLTATDLDRHNYCAWRIGGEFRLFDPMVLYTGTLQ